MIDALAGAYRDAPGFVLHMSHPTARGWCVMDVWRSKEHFQRFYAEHIAPKLPPTLRPKIAFQELHDAISPFDGFLPGRGIDLDAVTPFDSAIRTAAAVRA
jgi:hypothetical protein